MNTIVAARGHLQPQELAEEQHRPPARARWWRSGWLPAALLLAGVLVTMHEYHVPVWDLLRYGLFLAVCVTLPGTLIWRAVTKREHAFAEEVAAGMALGFTLEVLTYIPARALGVPLLVLIWPVATILVFALRPSLRGYWRGSGVRAPAWHSWALTVLIGLIFAYCVAGYFRHTGIAQPGYGFADTDSPWYVAIIGELRHHMPPMIPNVPEGPVYYHWFGMAEMAATSWSTGIEPFILLRRLSVLAYLAVLALMIPAIARRLTGRWWTGPVALAVAFFVSAPHPFAWFPANYFRTTGFGAIEDGSLLRFTLWYGMPQSFGAAVFAPAVLLLVGLLGGQLRGRGVWLVFTALLVAVAGGKATYLPLLFAGLGCAVLVGLLRRQTVRPALAAAGIALVCLAGSIFILLGGVASGLRLGPLHALQVNGIGAEAGFLHQPFQPLNVLVILGIVALCWTCVWCGLIGLRRSGMATSQEMVTFLGMGVAGLAGMMLFAHSGLSQVAFLQSARPYLSIAAVVGFAAVVGSGIGRRAVVRLAVAALAGFAAVLALRLIGSPEVPTAGTGRPVLPAVALPYVALAGLALIAAVALWLWPRTRAAAMALVMAGLMGMGLESTAHDRLARPIATALAEGWHPTGFSHVNNGTLEAGRWIRDHSRPSDVVATNAHCLFNDVRCNNARFGATAFSERRVLIEGWGYNQRTLQIEKETGTSHMYVPYWNPELLAINDAAFATPSAQTIGRLRDEFGVRWLFVDRSISPPAADLGDFARLSFVSGDCEVYEVLPGV